jgi:hypothetical protein
MLRYCQPNAFFPKEKFYFSIKTKYQLLKDMALDSVETPKTANVDGVHLQNLLYFLTDEFILVYLT